MLLMVRLRALLFQLCPDHEVAFCESCHRGYRAEQLGIELGNAFSCCRQCGADLQESLKAHARTCPSFLVSKPPARVDARPPTRPLARSRRLAV